MGFESLPTCASKHQDNVLPTNNGKQRSSDNSFRRGIDKLVNSIERRVDRQVSPAPARAGDASLAYTAKSRHSLGTRAVKHNEATKPHLPQTLVGSVAPGMTTKLRLYVPTFPSSDAYKVQLLLSHLRIPYETRSLNDSTAPETRVPEFPTRNDHERSPTIILDGGTALAGSNAILFHLAQGTQYLPHDRLQRSQVLQWLFFEQHLYELCVALSNQYIYVSTICGRDKGLEREIANLQERGQTAIDGIEMYLAEDNTWLVGNSYSIADICLYACTSMAEAVGFRIDRNMRSWLSRVEEVDGWEEYETACT